MRTKILLSFVMVGLVFTIGMANPIIVPFILEFSVDPPWIEICSFTPDDLVGETIRTMESEATILSAEDINGIVLLDSSNTTGFTLNPDGDSIIFSIEYFDMETFVGYGTYGAKAGTPLPGMSIVSGIYEDNNNPYYYTMGYDFCLTPTPGEWNGRIWAGNLWGSSKLIINEVAVNNTSGEYPNFIELYNASNSPINTEHMLLIGNSVYEFPAYLTIGPGEFYVIDKYSCPEFFDFNPSSDVLYLVKLLDSWENVYSVVDQVGWSSNHGENISLIRFPDGNVNWYNWGDFMGYNDETSYTFRDGDLTPGTTNSLHLDIEEIALPEYVANLKCFPNPFNAQTTISFSLMNNSHVEISIYDITGRLVEVVTNKAYPVGEHSIVWNAGNMPSGMYFARLATDKSSTTERLVLLK